MLLQRKNTKGSADVDSDGAVVDGASISTVSLEEKEPFQQQSNLVFGYLNLFSDGVVSVFFLLFLLFENLKFTC